MQFCAVRICVMMFLMHCMILSRCIMDPVADIVDYVTLNVFVCTIALVSDLGVETQSFRAIVDVLRTWLSFLLRILSAYNNRLIPKVPRIFAKFCMLIGAICTPIQMICGKLVSCSLCCVVTVEFATHNDKLGYCVSTLGRDNSSPLQASYVVVIIRLNCRYDILICFVVM